MIAQEKGLHRSLWEWRNSGGADGRQEGAGLTEEACRTDGGSQPLRVGAS
jgi:hypothetical protein